MLSYSLQLHHFNTINLYTPSRKRWIKSRRIRRIPHKNNLALASLNKDNIVSDLISNTIVYIFTNNMVSKNEEVIINSHLPLPS